MSDLLLHPEHAREPMLDSFSDEANTIGLDGIEFIEYATAKPQQLGQVLEMMGFRPVARHRSREVLLYRQGGLNIVVNAHPPDAEGNGGLPETPTIAAVAVRVRDARAAYQYVMERGAWEVPTHPEAMELNIPAIQVSTGSNDPAGFDLVVNATPLGMNPGDPLPVDMARLEARTFVGEVVMKTEMTAFLTAAQARGCRVQVGSDMLFEQIPAYLEFFGFPTTTAGTLRAVARLQY